MMHGFMLDSARLLESRAYYRQFIDFIADRGCDTLLWHFNDDQGCSLKFDCLPDAASPNAYSKDELRDLIAYATTRGITMIPELETLGHTRYITRSNSDLAKLAENDDMLTAICPVSPQTRDILAALLNEVCALFPSPLVHVGMDEVNFGDHPLTQKALQNKSKTDLFVEHLQFLHQHLAKWNKHMIMWADHPIKDPTIASDLPRDIIMANWQYEPQVPWETTQTLMDMGFEVLLCSSMICYAQTLFPGKRHAIPNLIETARQTKLDPRIVGSIVTIWTPQRFMHNTLWPAVDYSAALLRQQGYVPLKQTLPTFAKDFHGFDPSAQWIDAMQQLFDHMPKIQPWVDALALTQETENPVDERIKDAKRWAAIRNTLQSAQPQVTQNREAYDTLLLMTKVLAHVWRRAACVQQDSLDVALLNEAEQLSRALHETWDHERFADDPRRTVPVFSFDEPHHLVLLFDQGTRRLRQLLQSAQPAST